MKITKQQLTVILESVGIQNPYVESAEYPVYPETTVELFKTKSNIDLNSDPAAKDNFPIRIASQYGDTKLVELLLTDSRVNPSANNNQAIRTASENGHDKVVKLLLSDKRVDPTDNNNYALKWAMNNGRSEVIKLLLEDKRITSSDDFSISKLLKTADDVGAPTVKTVLLDWIKKQRQ